MAEAADRDSIARQWITSFADVFETGMPYFEAALARWGSETWAATATFLGLLARLPDSHIVRKYGTEAAEAVRREAARASARLDASIDPEQLAPELLAWDADLKRRGLNPGTSADLTVAAIFARRLRNALRRRPFAG
jgi:triphosphoribosyl-dephospho-CoA synthase